eukprot:TRINITY_DN25695_c0_g1_i1.p1 TRINITY_DN25695_c0_g1~~TRINITY_DN25695_c0_g1_i1.p1  ORF type:complete len:289 (-),score=69.35 TRINITY_DN25695_c0_g1_i1:170-988(-)
MVACGSSRTTLLSVLAASQLASAHSWAPIRAGSWVTPAAAAGSRLSGTGALRIARHACSMSGRQRASGRPSLDDVERISFGKAAKKRGTGSRGVCHRLNADERAEWELAKKRGYLVLRGTGYRKERKGSPLGNIFRQYCDAKAVPFVSLEQAVGINAVDEVHVDLSPLRQRELDAVKREIDALAMEFGASRVESATVAADPLQYVDDDALEDDVIWRLPQVELVYTVSTRKQAKELGEKLFAYWLDRNTQEERDGDAAEVDDRADAPLDVIA